MCYVRVWALLRFFPHAFISLVSRFLFLIGLNGHRRRLEEHPLQVRHKQDWGRGFILLLPQTAALPKSDAGSDINKLS